MRALWSHLARLGRMLVFLVWFAGLVVSASIEVAVDVLTPRSRLAIGVIAFPLRCATRGEVSTFAALVNLTPGTLTLAIRDGDPPRAYVHAMYTPDRDALMADLEKLESRYLAAVRLRTGKK